MINRTRVGVLRGGPSNEHDVSLSSGESVLHTLNNDLNQTYVGHDIFIDREGKWHIDSEPISANDLTHRIDVVFNSLHGTFGEDGQVQSFLESHQIPFTGTGSLGSAVGMNKLLTKKVVKDHGIVSPYAKEISASKINSDMDNLVAELFETLILPVVVKPASSGSSVGISLVRKYADLPQALREAAKHSAIILLEEFIRGIETTCGIIENFRDKEIYALPPIEIKPKTNFFDYEAKYGGQSEEIVPASFSSELKQEIEALAIRIHQVMGLRHYSRSDFIIHPRRGIYFLEVNTLPGLTKESLIPKALRAVGSDLKELTHHLIQLALQ